MTVVDQIALLPSELVHHGIDESQHRGFRLQRLPLSAFNQV